MSAENPLDPIVFDSCDLIEVPVAIGKVSYKLREASGGDAIKWRNFFTRQTRINEEGKLAGLGDMADGEALLVSMCLYEVLAAGELANQPVPITTVRAFPSRMLKVLFARCKEISELDEVDTEDALVEEIAKLTAKLEKLKGDKTPAKND
jgi:hypothetical protein